MVSIPNFQKDAPYFCDTSNGSLLHLSVQSMADEAKASRMSGLCVDDKAPPKTKNTTGMETAGMKKHRFQSLAELPNKL